MRPIRKLSAIILTALLCMPFFAVPAYAAPSAISIGGNAGNAVTEFSKGLKVNVSYDAACSSMLLKIHKELKQ